MNELIAKLSKQVADLNARMEASLTAAEADGVTAEDKARHLAEFDAAAKERDAAQASLKRAEGHADAQRAHAAAQAAPRTADVHTGLHNPAAATAGRTELPAHARRHGPLRAFKTLGPMAAYRAGRWAAAALFVGSQHVDQGLVRQSADWCRENGVPLATLNESDDAKGGVFVPHELDQAIVELYETYGVIRRTAEVVPMSSDQKTSPRWTKGMIAYWIGEGQRPTQGDPAWDPVTLIAKKLAAMTKMADELSEDSLVDLGEKVAMAAALAFSYAEDNAAFNGDGTSQYGGITGIIPKLLLAANAASLVVAPTGQTSVPALTLADYLKLVGVYPSYANAKPEWFCHKATWAGSMAALQLAGGGNRIEDIAAGGRPEFMGYPVNFVPVLPNTYAAATVPVVFGDLSLAVKLGDRRRSRGIRAGYENDDFTRELRTLLATERVDINVHTVVDPKDNTKAGPVVGLQLAAS